MKLKIVDASDLKYKIIVTMMASTGCRIGAISNIKISDLIYIKKEKLLPMSSQKK